MDFGVYSNLHRLVGNLEAEQCSYPANSLLEQNRQELAKYRQPKFCLPQIRLL